MNSFLYHIASLFYNEYKGDIRKFTFVFPNRRAGYFFQKYLSELIDQVIFAPEVMAVNDLFYSVSENNLTDRTKELFRLYEIYKKISGSSEGFDDFVFWGEVLLSDFDDIDKYRLDAKQIFTNVRDLKEIDYSFEYLTDEQREAIKRFWAHFLPETDKETKKNFVEIWKVLYQLYDSHRKELKAEGLATEGMLFREVVEQLENDTSQHLFDDKSFVFIGFNALNPCEKALFTELKKRNKADFYWDYYADELQDKENNASLFFAENIKSFPSKLKVESKDLKTNLDEKLFEVFAIPSAIGQVKMVYQLLEKINPKEKIDQNWLNTAVVLPDEKLLVPLLYSLPDYIESINITMGYPLNSTPVVSLIDAIFNLHRRSNSKGQFYHKSVKAVLNHQLIYSNSKAVVDEALQSMVQGNMIYVDDSLFEKDRLLKIIFKENIDTAEFLDYTLLILTELIEQNEEKDDLSADFLYQYYISINRLNDVIKESANLDISLETLHRLLRQLVNGITIPFEGEPLNGLQIMGTLETRGLDFENLIICSFNEGVFPKGHSSISFVPYNLRRAFNLPTEEYHDAIASYNFYRLIQRSKNVYFLYDNRTDGMQTGEVSRYLYQLQYHYGIEIKQNSIAYDVKLPNQKEIRVEKTEAVMKKLQDYLHVGEGARWLSPSSINTYLDCPLRFYFSYIEKLRETDEIEEGVEAAMFGTLLHYVMEHVYKRFEGKIVQKEHLQAILANEFKIDNLIREAFAVELYNLKSDEKISEVTLEGEKILFYNVIKKQIRQILKLDMQRTPFLYIQSEENCKMQLPIFNGKQNLNLMGKIDRVDAKDDVVRVLDYKTGSDELEFKNLEQVFEKDSKKRPKVVLQTLLYSLLYQEQTKTAKISPEVLLVRNIFKADNSTQLHQKDTKSKINEKVVDFNHYKDEFVELLTKTTEEIFNPEVPFSQCEEIELCKYCPYINICHR